MFPLPILPPDAGRSILEAGPLLGARGTIPKLVHGVVLETFWLCTFSHSFIHSFIKLLLQAYYVQGLQNQI